MTYYLIYHHQYLVPLEEMSEQLELDDEFNEAMSRRKFFGKVKMLIREGTGHLVAGYAAGREDRLTWEYNQNKHIEELQAEVEDLRRIADFLLTELEPFLPEVFSFPEENA